jgi:hypothetical protein
MGLILDSSIVIVAERQRETVAQLPGAPASPRLCLCG